MKKHLLVALGAITLISCGGGGGGNSAAPSTPPVSYSGSSSPVALSTSNAATMSLSVLDLASTGGGLNVFGVETSATPPLVSITLNIVEHMRGVDTQFLSHSVPGITIDETDACTTSGTLRVNVEANQATNEFSGTFTYNDCNESGLTLNGEATVEGQFDAFGELTGPFSLTTSRLNFTDDANSDFDLAGTLECTFGSYPDANGVIIQDDLGSHCAQNLIAASNTGGASFKLENFETIHLENIDPSSGFSLSAEIYKGRLFHSDFGYIDISSLTNTQGYSLLLFVAGIEVPISGELVLVGANNSTSQLIPNISNPTYTLNIDADGDGNFESSSVEAW